MFWYRGFELQKDSYTFLSSAKEFKEYTNVVVFVSVQGQKHTTIYITIVKKCSIQNIRITWVFFCS